MTSFEVNKVKHRQAMPTQSNYDNYHMYDIINIEVILLVHAWNIVYVRGRASI